MRAFKFAPFVPAGDRAAKCARPAQKTNAAAVSACECKHRADKAPKHVDSHFPAPINWRGKRCTHILLRREFLSSQRSSQFFTSPCRMKLNIFVCNFRACHSQLKICRCLFRLPWENGEFALSAEQFILNSKCIQIFYRARISCIK